MTSHLFSGITGSTGKVSRPDLVVLACSLVDHHGVEALQVLQGKKDDELYSLLAKFSVD